MPGGGTPSPFASFGVRWQAARRREVQALLLLDCEPAATALPPATASVLDRCRSEKSRILQFPLWLQKEGAKEPP